MVCYRLRSQPAGTYSPLTPSSHFDPWWLFSVAQAFQFTNARIYGYCGHFKISFLFQRNGVCVCVWRGIHLQSHLLRGKDEERGKQQRHCGMSKRFSVIICVIGYLRKLQYVKSSIWLWSHMSRRGMYWWDITLLYVNKLSLLTHLNIH